MEKITLSALKSEDELDEIVNWDKEFRGTPEFIDIYKFILENGDIKNLSELIATNYEIYPIGDDERKLILVAKDEEGKIVGFTIQSTFNLRSNSPNLHLQYIVVHPKFEHKGVGTKILQGLGSALEKELGKRPDFMFTKIQMNNKNSIKLFKNFGMKFLLCKDEDFKDYYHAYGDMPKFESTLE